ncbi:MAG: adenylyl-sulfate kinase [Bacteroidetes bacterium]|nr:adenylyl-sulfate kinase [Bacteroidota bacterium]
MNEKSEYIYPTESLKLDRESKEKQLNQRAKVIWMTGLSGAGKTTLSYAVESALHRIGYFVQTLDGDNVRTGINKNLGFSDADRYENIRRIAEVSKLFVNCGIITIASFISPTNEIRLMAKTIIGHEDFIEIFINAPLDVCESRDTKGLYMKARKGEIKEFTGINAPYESPAEPELEVRTDLLTIEESTKKIIDFLLPIIWRNR